MIATASAKYTLMAMSAFDIAVFLGFGVIASIVAAFWLGE